MATKSGKARRASTAVAVPVPPRRQWWPYAVAFLFVLFAVFEVYGPALNGPFLLDDSYLPYQRTDFVNLPLKTWIAGVRPVLMFTFWLNFQQSGNRDTYPYHAVNVFLHFLNGLLVWLAVRKILDWARVDKPTADILSAFAAGLFLLHPIQTEAVSYVASRSDTLSVFFVLAAFVVFLYRKAASISFAACVAVLVLFGAGVLSKEHAVALAGLFLLTDYFWNPGFQFEGIRRNWRLYGLVAIGAVPGLLFVWRILSQAKTAGFGLKDFTWYQYFFTECRVIWEYFRFFVLPFGQNLDPDVPISKTVFEHGAIFGLVALLALIALAWYYRRKFPLVSYGVFTFLVLLAPTSSFVPIQDPLAERRLYIAFIGLLFILVGLLRLWKTTRTTLIVTLSIVLVLEGALAYQRNQLYSNAIAIWQDTVANSPNKLRPRFQLAFAQYQAGHCGEAVEEFGKAAQLARPDYDLLVDWSLAYDCAGNAAMAIEKMKAAAILQPSAHTYSQLGMQYAKHDKYSEALDALNRAAALDPNFEMTYVYRGNVFQQQHDLDQAAEDYRRVLALTPQTGVDEQAHALARTALQSIGR